MVGLITGQVGSGVQVVQVVRMISLDDMNSKNIWFSWSKPTNYRGKLRCHARDIRTEEEEESGNKEQCSVRPEIAIVFSQ